MSVQLSLIALFRNLNLDLLVAGRTAPCHSWKNPVERIVSIVNEFRIAVCWDDEKRGKQ